MKIKYSILLIILITFFSSCEKILDVNSDHFVDADNYRIDKPQDTIYAMSSVFLQLQKIAVPYVLLGELRGDLVDVTGNAYSSLKEINSFSITPGNPYANIKDYYALINNCNLVINKIDTSVMVQGRKVLLQVYAAAKAIRAWTYMQIALNYGKAVYYNTPILKFEDAEKNYPEYGINELAGVLIPDLIPLKDIDYLQLKKIGELVTDKFYFPVRYLLGELYLWSGQYEMAAREYYDLINRKQIRSNFKHYWYKMINGEIVEEWSSYNTDEILSVLGTSIQNGSGTRLSDLSLPLDKDGAFIMKKMIEPSQQAVNFWESQVYYYDTLYTAKGDMRGKLDAYKSNGDIITMGSGTYAIINEPGNFITKYYSNSRSYEFSEIIPVCTAGLLYLRYAEAVNRLGKPNLAFAVLKHGLTKVNMSNRSIIPSNEIPVPKPYYMNFDTTWFKDNIGMHARGCGNVEKVSAYKIPSLPTKDDSVAYVEDQIVLELALDNAFLGNRFHDLMRIALRRNDPSYLADKVSAKYTANKDVMRSRLMNTSNWYLPK